MARVRIHTPPPNDAGHATPAPLAVLVSWDLSAKEKAEAEEASAAAQTDQTKCLKYRVQILIDTVLVGNGHEIGGSEPLPAYTFTGVAAGSGARRLDARLYDTKKTNNTSQWELLDQDGYTVYVQ